MKIVWGIIGAALVAAAARAAIPLSPNDAPGAVEGVVTFARGGDRWFFVVDDAGKAWRIERDAFEPPPAEGDRIAATGTLPKWNAEPRLNHATVETIGREAKHLPPPRRTTIRGLYALDPDGEKARRAWWGRIVSVKGKVVDINRRETFTQILLTDGGLELTVALPVSRLQPLKDGLELGATIRAPRC